MRADNTDYLIAGFSAKERAQDKAIQILQFLRDETWSHIDVITLLLGTKSPQVAQRALAKLETDGLVVRHAVAVGTGRALTIWGITPEGVAASYVEGEEIPLKSPRYFEASKVSLVTMRHRLDIQKIRVKSVKIGWTGWRREDVFSNDKNRKNPDAIADTHRGTAAIEIERTLKRPVRYASILASHLIAISRLKRYTDVFYFSPTTAMRDRVKAIFSGIKTVKVDGRDIEITAKHLERFHFLTYDEPIR